MEATVIGIVPSSVGQLPVVHIVLSSAIPLDDANDDQQQQQERNGQHHADEPSGRGHILVRHLQRALCRDYNGNSQLISFPVLLPLIPSLTDSISVHVLRATLGHVLPINGHDTELVVHVRLQSTDGRSVVDNLRIRDEPLALPLQPVLDEEVRARLAGIIVRVPRHLNVCQAIIGGQSVPAELGHIWGFGRATSCLSFDKVTVRRDTHKGRRMLKGRYHVTCHNIQISL